jgi:RNA polymerase sigma factor (sigma-70 family)
LEAKQLFEVLVREHIGSVRAFLLAAVRNANVAEDLVQEAFLVAWSNIHRYDRKLPFGPWVRGIASRLLWNHRRKQVRSKVTYVEAEDLQALERQFERVEQAAGDTFEEKVDALRLGMARLTPLQRQVLDLHYEHDLSCADIATRLGLGIEAVKKHMQRGRAALLRRMEGHMPDPAAVVRNGG